MVTVLAPPAVVRAAIYCRVSTDSQERDGTSLDTQEAACRRYAAERGYTVAEAHVYREAFSGAEFHDRPRLGEMRAELRALELDIVVAYAVDRLSRDQVHIWLLLDEIDRADARLEMVTESFDDSPTGKFLLSARAFAAEVERVKIRERSGRARLENASKGRLAMNGTDRYGYRRVVGENRREIHEPEAAVVRDIFESYGLRGESLRSIMQRLNDAGVPSPGADKRAFGRRTYWGKSTTVGILSDPVYKGETYARRWQATKRRRAQVMSLRPTDEWIALGADVTPMLVSPELWTLVQERLAVNKGATTRNATRPFLLRGLVVCETCGRKMRTSSESRGNRRRYRCSSRETPQGPCGAPRARADEIEQEVWDAVAEFLRDPSKVANAVARAKQASRDPALESATLSARRRVARIERDQQRLVQDATGKSGRLWELVEREVERLEEDRTRLLAEVAELDRRREERQQATKHWLSIQEYCARVADRLESLDFNGRRLALEALDVAVTVHGDAWWLTGGVPADSGEGILSASSTRSARPIPAPGSS